jgi:hypothetical protein
VGKYKTRDPQVTTRDPKPQNVAVRRFYIEASMPTVCPKCGHNTRMDDGRHVDPVRRRILEYRRCAKCNAPLAAGRAMTAREAEKYCTHAEAVAEYETSESRTAAATIG